MILIVAAAFAAASCRSGDGPPTGAGSDAPVEPDVIVEQPVDVVGSDAGLAAGGTVDVALVETASADLLTLLDPARSPRVETAAPVGRDALVTAWTTVGPAEAPAIIDFSTGTGEMMPVAELPEMVLVVVASTDGLELLATADGEGQAAPSYCLPVGADEREEVVAVYDTTTGARLAATVMDARIAGPIDALVARGAASASAPVAPEAAVAEGDAATEGEGETEGETASEEGAMEEGAADAASVLEVENEDEESGDAEGATTEGAADEGATTAGGASRAVAPSAPGAAGDAAFEERPITEGEWPASLAATKVAWPLAPGTRWTWRETTRRGGVSWSTVLVTETVGEARLVAPDVVAVVATREVGPRTGVVAEDDLTPVAAEITRYVTPRGVFLDREEALNVATPEPGTARDMLAGATVEGLPIELSADPLLGESAWAGLRVAATDVVMDTPAGEVAGCTELVVEGGAAWGTHRWFCHGVGYVRAERLGCSATSGLVVVTELVDVRLPMGEVSSR